MKHEYLFVYEWKYSRDKYEKVLKGNTIIEAKNVEDAMKEFHRVFKNKDYIENTILNIIKIK